MGWAMAGRRRRPWNHRRHRARSRPGCVGRHSRRVERLMLGLVGSPDAGPAENRSRVTLKWDAGSHTLRYRRYIGTSSQSYQQVADVERPTKSVVSNLPGHMTYYFVVSAYNSAGESCPSNEVSVPIP